MVEFDLEHDFKNIETSIISITASAVHRETNICPSASAVLPTSG
jgi:hypothetical protein